MTIVDNGPKRATMAVHGPSGVGVVAASTYPASERRAILVLPTVIEASYPNGRGYRLGHAAYGLVQVI